MRTKLVSLVALGLLLVACSGEETDASSTTLVTSTTQEDPSTSTTQAVTTSTSGEETLSLINGLPVDDPDLIDRRVLAVKVDNHPNARPQSGINHADMVIELMVEGITRFLTIWHESDVDYLGPNRSGRPTDAALLKALNEPSFSISGGQAWVQNLIKSKDIFVIKELSPGTFRISGRFAPHNLYVNTFELRETADAREFPDNPPEGPLWDFGPMSDNTTEPVSEVDFNFSGNHVRWVWDAATGTWLRFLGTSTSDWIDQDGTRGQISVPVMVALEVELYSASPPAGVSGSSLPSSHVVGSGNAYVFADGEVAQGTWTRESEEEWFTLTNADGNTIYVPPGQSWVSLVSTSVTITP